MQTDLIASVDKIKYNKIKLNALVAAVSYEANKTNNSDNVVIANNGFFDYDELYEKVRKIKKLDNIFGDINDILFLLNSNQDKFFLNDVGSIEFLWNGMDVLTVHLNDNSRKLFVSLFIYESQIKDMLSSNYLLYSAGLITVSAFGIALFSIFKKNN